MARTGACRGLARGSQAGTGRSASRSGTASVPRRLSLVHRECTGREKQYLEGAGWAGLALQRGQEQHLVSH
eukprot:2191344-Rhodomonas_salina.1